MIPKYAIGFLRNPIIHGDDSRELIQIETKKYYLPGDTKCIILRHSGLGNTEEQMKQIRVITADIAIKVKSACEAMKQQFKPIEIIINDNIREVLEENFVGTIGSIKETLKKIYKRYPRDPNLFIRPIKIIKATRLNRKIKRIIYYHIRSNC